LVKNKLKNIVFIIYLNQRFKYNNPSFQAGVSKALSQKGFRPDLSGLKPEVWGRLICCLLFIAFFNRQFVQAQKKIERLVPKSVLQPAIKAKLPVIKAPKADTLSRDSLQIDDSDLTSTVEYSSKDSSSLEGDEMELWGDAKVIYGSIILTADYIKLNRKTNEIFAKGTYDSTARKLKGRPVFQDGQEKYDTDQIRYNFKTKKGLITQLITKQGDGNIRGGTVKKDSANNMYIRNSIYTTCDMPEPHFHISSKRLKLVNNKQVVSGPFNLVIAGIPTPIGLPFGFFPFPKNKEQGTSGVIMPQYGEEPTGRGYYLRDGGYYFAISDRINLTLKTQIYSKGSWGVGAVVPYSVRYRYSGNLMLNFNRNKTGDEVAVNNLAKNDFSLNWSHTPVARGKSSFSASVNLGSNSYNQNNSFDTQQYIQSTATSSVQYNRTFGQYGRAGTSFRVNQRFPANRNERDASGRAKDPGTTDAGIDLNFGINQIAPFALKGGTGRWYESFRVGMDFNGGVSASNTRLYSDTSGLGFKVILGAGTYASRRPTDLPTFRLEGAGFDTLYDNRQFQGRYSIPISLPNIKFNKTVLQYINITPGISLSGQVFTEHFEYANADSLGRVRVEKKQQIELVNSISFNAGVNTRIFGTYKIRGRRLEAIRHTIVPSASFSYVPDQSNLYQEVVINAKGDRRFLNKYGTIGGPQGGIGKSSQTMSWSINNLLEAKLRPKSDSANKDNKEFEKKSLLNNLSINGSYDFTKEELRASDISVSTNAQLSKNIDFNVNATFDPYKYVKADGYGEIGQKVNKLLLEENYFKIGQLSNLNFSVNARFAPKGADKKKTSKLGNEQQLKQINGNPDAYVDFTIPWTLALSYSYNYSQQGLATSRSIQTLSARGDFSLTPKWKFVYNTGYDFEAKSISYTNVQITRDLHCWEMSFQWTPFAAAGSGRASNYSFDLRVKSALLKDLKLSRRKTFYDRGGF
jgi:lipopolysaccharide assembly outer membrane protein LptD (OstA)